MERPSTSRMWTSEGDWATAAMDATNRQTAARGILRHSGKADGLAVGQMLVGGSEIAAAQVDFREADAKVCRPGQGESFPLRREHEAPFEDLFRITEPALRNRNLPTRVDRANGVSDVPNVQQALGAFPPVALRRVEVALRPGDNSEEPSSACSLQMRVLWRELEHAQCVNLSCRHVTAHLCKR